MCSRKGQTTIEMIVVICLIMVVFTLVVLIAHRKTVESNDFKTELDAKRVAQSIADNVNAIAEQGHGYYRFFTLPAYLFGGHEYSISIYANFVEINWENRHGEQGYITQIITCDATKHCLDKGGDKLNKVFDYNERVLVTCNRADLMLVEESFEPNTAEAGTTIPVSIELFNYGVLDAGAFNITFDLINQTGNVVWSNSSRLNSGLNADHRTTLYLTIPPQSVGSYNLMILADPINEINESDNVHDNLYNATIAITT